MCVLVSEDCPTLTIDDRLPAEVEGPVASEGCERVRVGLRRTCSPTKHLSVGVARDRLPVCLPQSGCVPGHVARSAVLGVCEDGVEEVAELDGTVSGDPFGERDVEACHGYMDEGACSQGG